MNNTYICAEWTGRSDEFHRPSLIEQIVVEKIPFAIDEWAQFSVEQEDEGRTMSFKLLLEVLNDSYPILSLIMETFRNFSLNSENWIRKLVSSFIIKHLFSWF